MMKFSNKGTDLNKDKSEREKFTLPPINAHRQSSFIKVTKHGAERVFGSD